MTTFMQMKFTIPNSHVGDLMAFLAERQVSGLEYHSVEAVDGRNRQQSGAMVLKALGKSLMTAKQIVEATGLDKKRVYSALTRLKKAKQVIKLGGRWKVK